MADKPVYNDIGQVMLNTCIYPNCNVDIEFGHVVCLTHYHQLDHGLVKSLKYMDDARWALEDLLRKMGRIE